MLTALRASLISTKWQRARHRPHAGGLEESQPCFDGAQKARRYFIKQNRHDLATALDRVLSEGVPYGERFQLNRSCRFCGCSESLRHRWFECRKVESEGRPDDFEQAQLEKTAWIKRQAQLHRYEPNCLWYRAICQHHGLMR